MTNVGPGDHLRLGPVSITACVPCMLSNPHLRHNLRAFCIIHDSQESLRGHKTHENAILYIL